MRRLKLKNTFDNVISLNDYGTNGKLYQIILMLPTCRLQRIFTNNKYYK